MLKHIVLTAVSISLLTACGKTEVGEQKDSLDYCNDTCRKASKCEDVPDNFVENCEALCAANEDIAEDFGCKSELEAANECSDRNFQCDADEPVCEGQFQDFSQCLDDADDVEEDSLCNNVCQKYNECEGAPVDYLEQCESSCANAESFVRSVGCESEFEAALECNNLNFDCDMENLLCEMQVENYSACILDSE